jgi:hypothetical protein
MVDSGCALARGCLENKGLPSALALLGYFLPATGWRKAGGVLGLAAAEERKEKGEERGERGERGMKEGKGIADIALPSTCDSRCFFSAGFRIWNEHMSVSGGRRGERGEG